VKVFRIRKDLNYQVLLPDVPESEIFEFTTFDCTSKLNSWQPPSVFCLYPLLKKGDFIHYGSGNLVASPRATEIVRTFFEKSGELLPLWYEGEQYTLLNILECVNVLDTEKTKWLLDANGGKVEIKEYSFFENRLPVAPIFKIPETRYGDVLTYEIDNCIQDEFKAFVEFHNLTGLLFEELWDSKNEL
jgi:hypothetical protein